MNVNTVVKNNNLAFGSFSVVVHNQKSEIKTFNLLNQKIKELSPETSIELNQTKLYPGFNSEPKYSLYEVTGKNMNTEHGLFDTFRTAGLQVIPTEISSEKRAEEGLKIFTNAIAAQKGELPKIEGARFDIKA